MTDHTAPPWYADAKNVPHWPGSHVLWEHGGASGHGVYLGLHGINPLARVVADGGRRCRLVSLDRVCVRLDHGPTRREAIFRLAEQLWPSTGTGGEPFDGRHWICRFWLDRITGFGRPAWRLDLHYGNHDPEPPVWGDTIGLYPLATWDWPDATCLHPDPLLAEQVALARAWKQVALARDQKQVVVQDGSTDAR